MARVGRLVNVAGPSDLYRPSLTARGEEEGLGQWLELAQGVIGAVAAKKQKKKAQQEAERAAKQAKMQAKIDKAVAAKLAAQGAASPGAGFSLAGFGGMLPVLLIAGVLLGPSIARALRGR